MDRLHEKNMEEKNLDPGRLHEKYMEEKNLDPGSKNAISWSKISKKCLKTLFLACFFKILPAAQLTWPKWGQNSVLGELEKSTWST